jgi:hypothetical protein
MSHSAFARKAPAGKRFPATLSAMKLCCVLAVVAGCSSEPIVTPGVQQNDTDGDPIDTAVVDSDPADAAPFPVKRSACVSRAELATDLPADQMGALEGELLAIVPPGNKACPSDPDHLHLQIAVGTKRYDVAITIDSELNAPLAIYAQKRAVTPIPADGWATATFSYEKDLAVPSADFTALARDALLTRLQTELTSAARVRIYGRSYTDGTGLHNVHRNGRDGDGLILIHHIDGGDRAIALRFANNVF